MAQLREIKKRIGAVKTIQRITKTMQMIATAKFTASLTRAKNSRAFTDTIRGLVSKVAAQAGDTSHPLLEQSDRGAGKELVLVLSSDRGLCGAYNSNVLRAAGKAIAESRAAGKEVLVDGSGRKAVAFFKYQNQELSSRHAVGDRPQYAAVEEIRQGYIDGHPAVRPAGRMLDSQRPHGTKYHRRPPRLDRFGLKPHRIEVDEFAMEGGFRLAEQGALGLYGFLQCKVAASPGQARGVIELFLIPAHATADQHTATG